MTLGMKGTSFFDSTVRDFNNTVNTISLQQFHCEIDIFKEKNT